MRYVYAENRVTSQERVQWWARDSDLFLQQLSRLEINGSAYIFSQLIAWLVWCGYHGED